MSCMLGLLYMTFSLALEPWADPKSYDINRSPSDSTPNSRHTEEAPYRQTLPSMPFCRAKVQLFIDGWQME